MDKFHAIKILATVVEQGGFTAAARRLRVSTSSVTKSIARLEADLDVQLLRRSTRHISLTVAGETLYRRCSPLLEAMDDLEDAIRDLRRSSGGTVRIVMPHSFGRVTFAPALSLFRERHPNIALEANFNDDPINLIREGYDLSVVSRDLPDSAMMRRVLVNGPMATVASPDYLARHGVPGTPEDLADHICIIGKFGADWPFRGRDGAPRTVRVNGSIKLLNGDVVREAAVAGAGIAQSTWWLFRKDLQQGKLVLLLDEHACESVPISIVYSNNRHMSREVLAVIDFLLDITAADPIAQPALARASA